MQVPAGSAADDAAHTAEGGSTTAAPPARETHAAVKPSGVVIGLPSNEGSARSSWAATDASADPDASRRRSVGRKLTSSVSEKSSSKLSGQTARVLRDAMEAAARQWASVLAAVASESKATACGAPRGTPLQVSPEPGLTGHSAGRLWRPLTPSPRQLAAAWALLPRMRETRSSIEHMSGHFITAAHARAVKAYMAQ